MIYHVFLLLKNILRIVTSSQHHTLAKYMYISVTNYLVIHCEVLRQ